jgi:hypothetical protein
MPNGRRTAVDPHAVTQTLPVWSENIAHDHRLKDRVDLFVDESGPRKDGTFALGALLIESQLADAALDFFNWLASQLEADHPALKAPKYRDEWKGRVLARATASTRERRAVGRGELLSDVARQSVYARCLDGIRRSPGTRAFALTYRWTGSVRGPGDQHGYRVGRAIQHALSGLSFQAVEVRHAYIDDGHNSHYTRGLHEYASMSGVGAVPHEFLDSATDRRVQVADLIAFAAHTSRFSGGSRVFPSAHSWLNGFVADRMIKAGNDVDHHVTEP